MKKRNMNGRDLLDSMVYITLIAVMAASFILLIGFTGGCEQDLLTVKQYILRAIPCVLALGVSVSLFNKLFK